MPFLALSLEHKCTEAILLRACTARVLRPVAETPLMIWFQCSNSDLRGSSSPTQRPRSPPPLGISRTLGFNN